MGGHGPPDHQVQGVHRGASHHRPARVRPDAAQWAARGGSDHEIEVVPASALRERPAGWVHRDAAARQEPSAHALAASEPPNERPTADWAGPPDAASVDRLSLADAGRLGRSQSLDSHPGGHYPDPCHRAGGLQEAVHRGAGRWGDSEKRSAGAAAPSEPRAKPSPPGAASGCERVEADVARLRPAWARRVRWSSTGAAAAMRDGRRAMREAPASAAVPRAAVDEDRKVSGPAVNRRRERVERWAGWERHPGGPRAAQQVRSARRAEPVWRAPGHPDWLEEAPREQQAQREKPPWGLPRPGWPEALPEQAQPKERPAAQRSADEWGCRPAAGGWAARGALRASRPQPIRFSPGKRWTRLLTAPAIPFAASFQD